MLEPETSDFFVNLLGICFFLNQEFNKSLCGLVEGNLEAFSATMKYKKLNELFMVLDSHSREGAYTKREGKKRKVSFVGSGKQNWIGLQT